MRSTTSTLRLVLPLILIATLFGGLAFSKPASAQAAVKIAMLGPFTGPVAFLGTEQLNFAKLAVIDYNKANGTSYQMTEVDTQLDPAKAVTGAQQVVSDNSIVGVVGPAGSQEVEAVTPIFEPANMAFVSASATRTSLTEKGVKTFFRVVPRDDVQGPQDARYMVDKLGAKLVYIIDDQTSYSTGLADEVAKTLTSLNVKSQRDSITQKDTDFSALVTRIKGASPDVVFMPFQVASQAAQLVKQLKEQGAKAIPFGSDGVFVVGDFIKNAAGTTEGAYVSNFAPDIRQIPADKDIVDAYGKAYTGSFSSFGGPAYAATMVVLEAVGRAAKAGTPTRASVLAEVGKTDDKTSILGIPVKFNDKHDIQGAAFYLFQVNGDAFVPLPSEPAATAAAPAATMAATPKS